MLSKEVDPLELQEAAENDCKENETSSEVKSETPASVEDVQPEVEEQLPVQKETEADLESSETTQQNASDIETVSVEKVEEKTEEHANKEVEEQDLNVNEEVVQQTNESAVKEVDDSQNGSDSLDEKKINIEETAELLVEDENKEGDKPIEKEADTDELIKEETVETSKDIVVIENENAMENKSVQEEESKNE